MPRAPHAATLARMLPANPLLQLVPARVPTVLRRMGRLVWSDVGTVTDIAATEPTEHHRPLAEAARDSLAPVAGPHHYGKLWDQRWWRLRLPRVSGRADLYLRWNDQAEATLHVEGVPHYGFDPAHRVAPLPAGAQEVWIESAVCQTGIWTSDFTGLDPQGSRFEGAVLQRRDESAWRCFHDLEVLDLLMRDELNREFPGREWEFGGVGVKPVLGRVSPLLRRLLRHLDRACDAFDTGGVPAALRALRAAYRDLPGYRNPPAAILTGHAHIDLVWLWPERLGEFKAVHTFAIADRMLERYPEFHFGYTQPASYAAVGRRSPEMLRRVRSRIREGRWEALGAAYVESDTLLACGEALARSLLLGQEEFRVLTGSPSPVLWLPDVFGYSGCLPQMLRETGVDSFFTTKLSWNAVNAFPHSSFVWAGIDGSEVVAHICQHGGYNQAARPNEIRSGADAHRQADVHPEFLAPTGFGDGGGGVTEDMCERARRLRSLSGVPTAKWGRIDAFFRRLGRLRRDLPVHRGELYFEYHRGTYTTHGDVKAAFRAVERALQTQEAAHCARGAGPLDPHAWRRIVFAQFHDYIPGSSIHEVYAEGRAEHARLASDAHAATTATLGAAGAEALFNPLPQPRTVLHDGKLLDLAPLAGAPIAGLPARPAPLARARGLRLTADRVDARFDARGRLVALAIDGRDAGLRGPANELWLYADHPHAFDAWDIDRQALGNGRADNRPAKARIEKTGAGAAVLAFERPLGAASRATVRYRVEAGSPVLRIEIDLDWREPRTLLKALFPTVHDGTDVRCGTPYGSVRRPQWPGPFTAEAMWEMPFSRWWVLPDDGETEGFALITEAKYGVSVRSGTAGLSLVRSAFVSNEDRGAWRGTHPEPLRRTLLPDVHADIGTHRIAYAVGRFDASAPAWEHPAALADSLFTPTVPYVGPACDAGLLGIDDAPSLQPAWARPDADGAWTLRLHETLGRRGTATVRAAPGWRLRRTDLAGADRGLLRRGALAFRPYEIVSLRFERTA